MSRPIFCGNFEYDARQNELERLFRKYGKVDRVDMKSGFAFIYMEDERDAEDAIRALDRAEFGRKGRRLRVEWTKHERGIKRPGPEGLSARRPPANTRPSKTLFVINFDPYNTRTRDLERHFEQYGKIVNVRIRKNFAFVQYDTQEDATKALDATNMSKLMDRVISVEYAVRDDDKKTSYSPDRNRDRSPGRRSYDRRRSPSPYRRERGSPDYGRGSSRSPQRRERGSPDYGHGHSRSPYRRDRTSPDHGRGASRSPSRRERATIIHRHEGGESPYHKERTTVENDHRPSRSPYRRNKSSPDNGRGPSDSPYGREKPNLENERSPSQSSYGRGKTNPTDSQGASPKSIPEPRDSPGYEGAESPKRERYRSRSPVAEE